MMSYHETFYNARCCVAPRYNPKNPTGYDPPGHDCPVYRSGDMKDDIVGYLSAGDHVEVLGLGGECNQFWRIDFRHINHETGTETTEGWVAKGCLEFFDKEEKKVFERREND